MKASSVADLEYAERLKGLQAMIGNTPLLAVHFTFRGRRRVIYAKAEQMNMTGSIKDRMAFHILRDAYRQGRLKPGDMIVEATSGNTGISFAALGRALGHAVEIFLPDWMSQERVSLISSLGAKIYPVCREQGGVRQHPPDRRTRWHFAASLPPLPVLQPRQGVTPPSTLPYSLLHQFSDGGPPHARSK